MQLSREDLEQYQREGYVVVRGGLQDGDLDPVIAEYEAYIDKRARELKAEGKITQLHEKEPFERRLTRICEEDGAIYNELDIMHFRGRAIFDFLRNDQLMDLVEGLVGPEISCNPIQHLRPKMPSKTAKAQNTHIAGWHQDAAVMREEADPYEVLTVWIPMCEATLENGCMHVIPGVVGQGILHTKSAVMEPGELPATPVVPLPMRKGDVLLMHKETPHNSTPNLSDTIRWSMDLRYQRTGTPSGRAVHPSFVVRSRAKPQSVLTDHAEWCRLWVEGLEQGQGYKFYRW
ncbi:MAG: phytanoyl-CoA dioxygenase family protein [Candidatus Latescibacteria bacterium]|nr:phytanoyl-CoA dioxygenase family protein [Candidatus Latescibacterota bacterium]